MATSAKGGKRLRAGRPALPLGEKRVLISFKFSPEVIEYLRKTEHAGGMTGLVEELILKDAKKQKTNKDGNG